MCVTCVRVVPPRIQGKKEKSIVGRSRRICEFIRLVAAGYNVTFKASSSLAVQQMHWQGHWHLNILMVSFRIILIIEVAAVVMSLQVATDSELNHD